MAIAAAQLEREVRLLNTLYIPWTAASDESNRCGGPGCASGKLACIDIERASRQGKGTSRATNPAPSVPLPVAWDLCQSALWL